MSGPFAKKLEALLAAWPSPVRLRCTRSSGGVPPNLFRFSLDESGRVDGDELLQYPRHEQRPFQGALPPEDVRALVAALARCDFEGTPRSVLDAPYQWVAVELDGASAHLSAERLDGEARDAVYGALSRLEAAIAKLR